MASTMTQVVSTCDEGLVREKAGSWGGIYPQNKQTTVHGTSAKDEQ